MAVRRRPCQGGLADGGRSGLARRHGEARRRAGEAARGSAARESAPSQGSGAGRRAGADEAEGTGQGGGPSTALRAVPLPSKSRGGIAPPPSFGRSPSPRNRGEE